MILILTPLPIERDELRRAGLDARTFRIEVAGHGKVEFAVKTVAAIREFKPDLVIGAGAAGGLADNVSPLDLVVAEQTVEHDFNLKFAKRPLPAFAGDKNSLAKLRELKFEFPVHFGGIASGDEDVIESQRAREIFGRTQALAVAWEGAGLARACRHEGVPHLEIRAITDRADSEAVDNFRKNLPEGMSRLAAVIARL